jgi:hypothetical protein
LMSSGLTRERRRGPGHRDRAVAGSRPRPGRMDGPRRMITAIVLIAAALVLIYIWRQDF